MEPERIPPCANSDRCWQLGQVDIFHALDHWIGFVPTPAQRKIILGMRKTTTVVAGRRFGKSELAGALIIMGAITHRKVIQYVISHSDDQARIIFDKVKVMALESPMVAPLITGIKEFPFAQITFKNESKVEARSTGNNNGKYIRGHEAHKIWIDEAAYVKKDVIDTAVSPMLTDFADLDYGGWLFQISTPLGRNHFYESFQRGLSGDPDYASFQFSSFDNPHISHDYIRRKQKEIPDIQFRTEYMGEFVDDQVCVFKWDSINDAQTDRQESFDYEKEHQYYVGVDIAKMHDYTAIVVIDGTDQKKCEVVYTERFHGRPYSYIVERVLSVAMQFSAMKILLDETGVGAGITEQVVAQLPQAEGFIFSQQSKISLINTLKTGLEQRRLKFPMANNVLADELRYYQYEMSDSGNLKMNAPSGKTDDFVIALALAYQKCAVMFATADVVLIEAKAKGLNSNGNSVINVQQQDSGNLDKEPSTDSPFTVI